MPQRNRAGSGFPLHRRPRPSARCPRAGAPRGSGSGQRPHTPARAHRASVAPVAVTPSSRPPFVTRLPVVERGAGVEDERARPPRRSSTPSIGVPRSPPARVVARRRATTVTARPADAPERDAGERARRGGGERREEVAVDERQHRLRLRIAEPAVVLEHARPVGRQHQADEQRRRRTAPRARASSARTGVTVSSTIRAERVVVDPGDGSERAHPAGVGPRVAVVRPLEVPRRGEARARRRRRTARRPTPPVPRGAPPTTHVGPRSAPRRRAPRGAPRPCRQTMTPFPAARPSAFSTHGTRGVCEQRRRGHAGGGHHLLGEALRPFDARRGRRRPEYGDPRSAASTSATPATSGASGPTTTSSTSSDAREPEQPVGVVGGDRVARRERRDPGAPRCSMELVERRRRRQPPGERVLPTARADEEYAHPHESTSSTGRPAPRQDG